MLKTSRQGWSDRGMSGGHRLIEGLGKTSWKTAKKMYAMDTFLSDLKKFHTMGNCNITT